MNEVINPESYTKLSGFTSILTQSLLNFYLKLKKKKKQAAAT